MCYIERGNGALRRPRPGGALRICDCTSTVKLDENEDKDPTGNLSAREEALGARAEQCSCGSDEGREGRVRADARGRQAGPQRRPPEGEQDEKRLSITLRSEEAAPHGAASFFLSYQAACSPFRHMPGASQRFQSGVCSSREPAP